MKQSATRSTRATSRAAKASQAGQNLSAVPAVRTLTDVVAAVEGGLPSAPKEPEEGLLSNVEVGAKVAAPVVNLSAVPEVRTLMDVEAPQEEAVPETYGPGEAEEADNEATDEGVMDVTNSIFEEAKDEEETEKEVAIVGLEAEEEQPVCSAEVEDAAMVMQAFGVTSLAGAGKFPWIIICNLF
jgi:hypothetical protein